ncbi:MAG: tetratricopeptide repeat protein [Fuerstia sp.]|nr:tetratricopeptide repeat protein [Fuerstiella sp.]
MSQKPAPSRPVVAPTRVSGGIPWWLWLILGVFGVFVVTTLVRKAIPEDPQLYVQEGMAALENGDIETIERTVQKLKDFPEYAPEQKLLEGMMYLGKSRPLLAIPFLEDASKEPKTRIKALTQLGNAYMRSHQRVACIAAYEAALKDDENADDARLSLAYILKDMISWDESLKHLTTLVDRKFKPAVVHQLMADIYADMGDYAKAAASYEAALVADPTSPTNSTKATRLITCRLETGNLEGIEGYLQGVDAAGVRESARALALAAKDETKQALSALDQALHESPNDITANVTYGKIMAGIGSKEKAAEALVSLQRLISIHSRNLKLFEIVAKLATIAEDEKLAGIAQQNVDQLKDLDSQFAARLNEVVKTREGAQARIELGDLAAAAGHLELARSIYQGAFVIDDKMEGVVTAKVQELYVAQPPLVSVGTGSAETQTEPPADPAPEVTPDPEPTPEPEKAATPEPDAAAKSDESAKAATDPTEPAPK